jgi:hypothetical protein
MEREARKESLRHQDSCLFVVHCLEGDSVFVVVEPRRILECPGHASWQPQVLPHTNSGTNSVRTIHFPAGCDVM